MGVPGFDPRWTDFPDYIIGITRQIWEDRNISTLHQYYSEDIIVRTNVDEEKAKLWQVMLDFDGNPVEADYFSVCRMMGDVNGRDGAFDKKTSLGWDSDGKLVLGAENEVDEVTVVKRRSTDSIMRAITTRIR